MKKNVCYLFSFDSGKYSFIHYICSKLLDKIFEDCDFEEDIIKKRIKKIKEKNANLQISYYAICFTQEILERINSNTKNNELFLELIDAISMLNYEGLNAKGRILISKKTDLNYDIKVLFKENIPLSNKRKIRKLLELSNDKLFLISNGIEVIGLGDVKDSIKGKVLIVEFNGFGNYSLYILANSNEIRKILISNNRRYITEDTNNTRFRIEERLTEIFPALKNNSKSKNPEKISNVIKEASKQVHGTMVVITEPKIAKNEVKRLSALSTPIEVLNLDNVNLVKELIPNLTSIDGAIFIDYENNCHAIGVILDGVTSNGMGNSARGARYNSALKYASTGDLKDKCLIVVISEDGMIDLIPEYNSVEIEKFIKEINKFRTSGQLEKAKYEMSKKLTHIQNESSEYISMFLDLLFKLGMYRDYLWLSEKMVITNEVILQRAKSYSALKEENKVLEELEILDLNNEKNIAIIIGKADLYYNWGYYEDAISCIDKGLEIEPDSENLLYRKVLFCKKIFDFKNLPSAIENYKNMYSDSSFYNFFIAKLHLEFLNSNKSKEYNEIAFQNCIEEPSIYIQKAGILFAEEKFEEAFNELNKIKTLNIKRYMVFYNAAELFKNNSSLFEALDFNKEAISLFSEDPILYVQKAEILYAIDNQNISNVKIELEKAASFEMKRLVACRRMAKLYQKLNEKSIALRIYRELYDYKSNAPRTSLELARILIEFGNTDEAKDIINNVDSTMILNSKIADSLKKASEELNLVEKADIYRKKAEEIKKLEDELKILLERFI